MTSEANWRAALDSLVAALKELYGERLESVILYGSRARGEADEHSAVNTLIVLNPCTDFWAEFDRLTPLASRVSIEHDVVISALPVDAEKYRSGSSPLLHIARREAVRVA